MLPHPRQGGLKGVKLGMRRKEKACLKKRVKMTQHPERNTMAAKRSPYYRDFPESQRRNIHPTDNDSHANAGLINSDVICYSNSILQVIASCVHLTGFFLSPPSEEHQRFRLYYKFAKVIDSMVTGGPVVVNPYKFMDIFMSYHENFVANECTYMHVVLSYCCVVVLLYCCIDILVCRVVLSYCCVVAL